MRYTSMLSSYFRRYAGFEHGIFIEFTEFSTAISWHFLSNGNLYVPNLILQ